MKSKTCLEIQDRLIADRFDAARADADALAHAAACPECRHFASDLDPIAKGVGDLKARAFDSFRASTESRHRVHSMLDVWAQEEGMRRSVSGRRQKTPASEPWFVRWFAWTSSSTPADASVRVLIQSVAGVGLVLFLAFMVHMSLARRQMAELSPAVKKGTGTHVESRPIENGAPKKSVR